MIWEGSQILLKSRRVPNCWIFVFSGNLEKKIFCENKSRAEFSASFYGKAKLCGPEIIVQKLKITHAQPTQKSIIFRRNWLKNVIFMKFLIFWNLT